MGGCCVELGEGDGVGGYGVDYAVLRGGGPGVPVEEEGAGGDAGLGHVCII